MTARSRSLRVLVPVAVLLASLAWAAELGAQEAPAEPITYVALGDSYAAGPLIPAPDTTTAPPGCAKSTNNYPKILAQRLGLDLRDATCSGARTHHMANPQDVEGGPNPPQLDRLDPSVDLVTLQIGGNDIGFFEIVMTCSEAALAGTECRDHYVQGDQDELRQRIATTAPLLAAVIQGIAERSPDARILVLGYPGIFRIGDGPVSCAEMLVGEEDALYLRGIQEELNEMIVAQAAANGATYVDVYAPSEGRTACDSPLVRWVEPIVPVNPAAAVHPNLNGMLGMADVIEPFLVVEPPADPLPSTEPPGPDPAAAAPTGPTPAVPVVATPRFTG
jgi:lysophospholipase L1-like esterase